MCVKRLNRWWPGIQLSSFCEPEVGSTTERLPRVPGSSERQDFLCSDGLRPRATNPSVHPRPRSRSRRILHVFQQYVYILVEGSTIVIQCILARAMLWRKRRLLLLEILGEQGLSRHDRKVSQYEPLERIPEHLSTLILMAEN